MGERSDEWCEPYACEEEDEDEILIGREGQTASYTLGFTAWQIWATGKIAIYINNKNSMLVNNNG